jgi:hypothetical protein
VASKALTTAQAYRTLTLIDLIDNGEITDPEGFAPKALLGRSTGLKIIRGTQIFTDTLSPLVEEGLIKRPLEPNRRCKKMSYVKGSLSREQVKQLRDRHSEALDKVKAHLKRQGVIVAPAKQSVVTAKLPASPEPRLAAAATSLTAGAKGERAVQPGVKGGRARRRANPAATPTSAEIETPPSASEPTPAAAAQKLLAAAEGIGAWRADLMAANAADETELIALEGKRHDVQTRLNKRKALLAELDKQLGHSAPDSNDSVTK